MMTTVLMAPPEALLVVVADEEEPYPSPPPLEDSAVVALPEVADPLSEGPPELLAPPPQLASATASTRARAATAGVIFIILSSLLEKLGQHDDYTVGIAYRISHVLPDLRWTYPRYLPNVLEVEVFSEVRHARQPVLHKNLF